MKYLLLILIALSSVHAKKDTTYTYYESGALMYEIPYVNGKEHGIRKGYYRSGVLLSETPYVNGKAHGIEKSYYESGALFSETPWINGKEHGISKDYYKSGKIESKFYYKNGIIYRVVCHGADVKFKGDWLKASNYCYDRKK